MSENEQEIREAAAVGAAAAVDAIVEEQHEDERANAVATAAVVAEESAQIAGEQAETAAETATAAAVAAREAQSEADTASAIAEQAASEASTAKSDVESLREHIAAGFSELRQFISESREPKSSEQPTEVVVTHDTRGQDSQQAGSNTGSGGSASDAKPDDRPYRHRFGRRR
jgi:hypothetical protein